LHDRPHPKELGDGGHVVCRIGRDKENVVLPDEFGYLPQNMSRPARFDEPGGLSVAHCGGGHAAVQPKYLATGLAHLVESSQEGFESGLQLWNHLECLCKDSAVGSAVLLEEGRTCVQSARRRKQQRIESVRH
jgi:hypothetical protein